MVVLDLALHVVSAVDEFKFDDFVEAMQVINDLGRTDLLSDHQRIRLYGLIEAGIVFTPQVRW